MINVSYTWMPKFKSPFEDGEVYLVPAVKDQSGRDWNYIVVCCSPLYNGVYKVPANNYKSYKRWKNGKLECYYVPFKDCELVKELDDLSVPQVIDKVIAVQQKWALRAKPKKTPKWFLEK